MSLSFIKWTFALTSHPDFYLLFYVRIVKQTMSLLLEQQSGGIPGQKGGSVSSGQRPGGERWLVSVCCENACEVRYVRYDFFL
jgi:hypothetical protein